MKADIDAIRSLTSNVNIDVMCKYVHHVNVCLPISENIAMLFTAFCSI